ncbi:MAG: protein TolQ [Alphaproteobacteria bacterium]|jgi:biopolymer transport protein TolQ|nr:protein TolQ [Alphaproteobacteria bacterium]|tara:strand:- start:688 stop:1449 length:762 start_codon:yes stop_codon:yes gene_type:complete
MANEVQAPQVDIEKISEGHDLSLLGLIADADIFVQLIMFLLVIASIWCWTIIINKSKMIRKEKKISANFEVNFINEDVDDDELFDFYKSEIKDHNQLNAQVKIFMLGMIEFNKIHSNNLLARDKYKIKELFQRIETVLQIEIAKQVEKLENGMSFLASIGSVGPFIGLLGTVWGIVNAFQSIAISNNTSLAVVAPGIAEALFATALGLLAAIPAVAAYNKFSNDLDKITSNLEYFSIEFLSKKLNEMEKKHNV